MLLGDAQAKHAELAHLMQDLAGYLARLLPRIPMRGDFLGDEVDGLLVDRLELVGHVGIAQRSFSHGRSPLKFRR